MTIDINAIREVCRIVTQCLVDHALLETRRKALPPLKTTINEPFLMDIFQASVMPGVLIMEVLAQTAGVLDEVWRTKNEPYPAVPSCHGI